MTCDATSRLIDRVALILAPHLGPDAADAVASEIVGDIQSTYVLLAQTEVDAARADLAAFEIPGLRGKGALS